MGGQTERATSPLVYSMIKTKSAKDSTLPWANVDCMLKTMPKNVSPFYNYVLMWLTCAVVCLIPILYHAIYFFNFNSTVSWANLNHILNKIPKTALLSHSYVSMWLLCSGFCPSHNSALVYMFNFNIFLINLLNLLLWIFIIDLNVLVTALLCLNSSKLPQGD